MYSSSARQGVFEATRISDLLLCMTKLNLFSRAYHRTRELKLARTIANPAGCEEIQSEHLAEVLLPLQSSPINDRIGNYVYAD
jgi:predicted ATPase with chaperone activity